MYYTYFLEEKSHKLRSLYFKLISTITVAFNELKLFFLFAGCQVTEARRISSDVHVSTLFPYNCSSICNNRKTPSAIN